MDQIYKKIKWTQYLLLGCALWFFGLGAVALLPILFIKEMANTKVSADKLFLIFSLIFISYGIGKNLAQFENTLGYDCTHFVQCIQGALLGP